MRLRSSMHTCQASLKEEVNGFKGNLVGDHVRPATLAACERPVKQGSHETSQGLLDASDVGKE